MKNTMLFNLTFLLLTLILVNALNNPFLAIKNLTSIKYPFINAYAADNGIVSLIRDEYGFYAFVDLNSHSSNTSLPASNQNPDTVPVSLALYTGNTLLMNNCLNFSQYTCSGPTCDGFDWTTDVITFPYFQGQGYEASALVYLDYNNWYLQDYATVVTSCDSLTNNSYGTARYGIVGMGAAVYRPGYTHSPINFSVYINKDLGGGQLLFKIDDRYAEPNTNQIAIESDYNFNIHDSNITLEIGTHQTSLDAVVIFDLNSDTIAFPQDMYKQIITFLGDRIQCSNDLIRPSCSYGGLIQDLPNIILYMKNQSLPIPPQIYVQNANMTGNVSSVTLNLKAISSNLTGECYVTQSYNEYIILDMNFMSFYYTTFQIYKSKSQVVLYIAGPQPPASDSNSYTWIYILCGCLGFAVIIAGFGYYYYLRRKKNKAKLVPMEKVSLLLNA